MLFTATKLSDDDNEGGSCLYIPSLVPRKLGESVFQGILDPYLYSPDRPKDFFRFYT